MITEQNACPMGLYIHKNDLLKMPKATGKIQFDVLSEDDILPNSYKIYLATELKAKSFDEVVRITATEEVEEIWTISDVPGWHFEPEVSYLDDKLSDILFDCDLKLGNVIRGVFTYY